MTKARLFAVLLFACVVPFAAYAQDTAKKEPPKPADSPSKVVLDNWNEIGRKIIAMAEDFPEDKYDFKPTPAQRPFSERLVHVAGVTYYFTNVANGQKPPDDESPKKYKTKAEIVAFVKKAFADGAAAIQAKGDKGMNDLVLDGYANQMVRVSDLAWGLIEHSGEIYGQLTGYYRVAGLVPPESRPKK